MLVDLVNDILKNVVDNSTDDKAAYEAAINIVIQNFVQLRNKEMKSIEETKEAYENVIQNYETLTTTLNHRITVLLGKLQFIVDGFQQVSANDILKGK